MHSTAHRTALFLCSLPLLLGCSSTEKADDGSEPYYGALTTEREQETLGFYMTELDARLRAWSRYKLTARNDRDLRTRSLLENELREKTAERFDELLVELASGPRPNRTIAAMALGFSKNDEALGGLVSALSDRDDGVVANALIGLGLLASPETPLAQVCFLLGSDPDGYTRTNAAYCVQRITEVGGRDDCILEECRFALSDTEPGVRAQCAATLGRIAEKEDADLLRGLLEDEEPLVIAAAVTALAELSLRFPEIQGIIGRHLVDSVERIDRTLRGTVFRQLHRLSGEDLGQDLAAWRDWAYRQD